MVWVALMAFLAGLSFKESTKVGLPKNGFKSSIGRSPDSLTF